MTLYDDGRVIVTEDAVILQRYYFPFGQRKLIRLTDIEAVDIRPIDWLSRWRLWGSSNLRNWLPLDLGRPRRKRMIVLDVGRRLRPTCTPDDVDRVGELIGASVAGAAPHHP